VDNNNCEKINIYVFPVLTDFAEASWTWTYIFIFRQRKITQQRRK